MTKKKKGQDGEGGDDDGEQSRTPIRSELDKLEGQFTSGCSLFCYHISSVKAVLIFCYPSFRKRADASAGSFEPAHQAAPEVSH